LNDAFLNKLTLASQFITSPFYSRSIFSQSSYHREA
jgi:hypothetical protein